MQKLLALLGVLALLVPLASTAQDGQLTLEGVAKALGAAQVKSIEYTGTGAMFAVGQSTRPGAPWPRFNFKSYTRAINYATASLREDMIITRVDARGGGLPAVGEARRIFVVSGDLAWNVTGETLAPTPVALTERQLQLWTTPHGVIKAAMANNATIQGRTVAFAVPGRFNVKATIDEASLVERIDAVFSSAVAGDMPVQVAYSDYRDFGGVKFPTRIRQAAGGLHALDLTVTEVRPNAPVDVPVPDVIRQATNPYARVTSQAVAEGVWYLTGGSHHSVAIEMKDHMIVVEGPRNEDRVMAVIGEVRKLVPNKPIRYVINSHHHFDHAGGLRAFAAEGVTIITHESSRVFFERALAAPATVAPDRQAKSGRQATVEGVRDKRVLTDGTRRVEIYHIAGSPHDDGLLMVYLPREKLLSQADAFTPAPPNSPPPVAVNPSTVNLADNIARLGLNIDQQLPLHGHMVPMAEMQRAIGREN